MPLVIGFGLLAFFIWLAENLSPLARAWIYPGQEETWQMVSIQKLGAWYLLMMISFVLVAYIDSSRDKTHDKNTSYSKSRRDSLPDHTDMP